MDPKTWVVSLFKLFMAPIGWFAGKVVGPRIWNWLFVWLLNQAPRVWGGKYGAYKHGRKSRDWLYVLFKAKYDTAMQTKTPFDDNAAEYVKGMFLFDVEMQTVVLSLQQALSDVSNDEKGKARERLVEVIKTLQMPVD